MNGAGCPICKISKLEEKTIKYLKKNQIIFKREKKFSKLKQKRYDFYIKDLDCLIEVDGEQHFKYIYHFHRTNKGFKNSILKDIKKNHYAISNNFHFLRISYKEIDYIETILESFINKVKKSNKQIIVYSNPKLYKKTYLFN